MLAISDDFDVDLMPKRLVRRIGRQGFHRELCLTLAQPHQTQQLLLKSFNSRPWIRPERTMAATPLRIPVMNNGNENAH